MADHPNQMLLDELLKQEQEPFHLNAFIKQKRSQLRRTARSGFRDDTVSIQVPSNTATLLAEAAERIQKRPKTGFFFGSFLNWVIVKDCKLLIGDHNNGVKSSSHESNDSNTTKRRGLSSDFCVAETRFCSSPFKFSFRRSTSSSATSPSHLVKREKEENQDHEEQSSPVSVLETSLGDYYGDESSRDSEDREINVQRLRDRLLNRIRRFEKLAESNSIKLDQVESANSEDDDSQVSMQIEEESDDDDEPLSLYKKERAEAFVSSELCFIPIPPSPKKKNHKFLEKDKGNSRETNINKMLLNKRALGKNVESDGIEAMVRLELKSSGDRKHSDEQIEEIVREIEHEMSEQLLDELCAVLNCFAFPYDLC